MSAFSVEFVVAFINFCNLYASENIGEVEVDVKKLSEYIKEKRFLIDWADCAELEDYYTQIEEIIIDGFPIWQFFKISDWTKKILSKEYEKAVNDHNDMLLKTFKCYSCKKFIIVESSFGVRYLCNYKEEEKKKKEKELRKKRQFYRSTREGISLPVRKCDGYEKGKPDLKMIQKDGMIQ